MFVHFHVLVSKQVQEMTQENLQLFCYINSIQCEWGTVQLNHMNKWGLCVHLWKYNFTCNLFLAFPDKLLLSKHTFYKRMLLSLIEQTCNGYELLVQYYCICIPYAGKHGICKHGLTVLVTVMEFGMSITEEARSHAVSSNLQPT